MHDWLRAGGVLRSGTLSPVESQAAELGLELGFPCGSSSSWPQRACVPESVWRPLLKAYATPRFVAVDGMASAVVKPTCGLAPGLLMQPPTGWRCLCTDSGAVAAALALRVRDVDDMVMTAQGMRWRPSAPLALAGRWRQTSARRGSSSTPLSRSAWCRGPRSGAFSRILGWPGRSVGPRVLSARLRLKCALPGAGGSRSRGGARRASLWRRGCPCHRRWRSGGREPSPARLVGADEESLRHRFWELATSWTERARSLRAGRGRWSGSIAMAARRPRGRSLRRLPGSPAPLCKLWWSQTASTWPLALRRSGGAGCGRPPRQRHIACGTRSAPPMC